MQNISKFIIHNSKFLLAIIAIVVLAGGAVFFLKGDSVNSTSDSVTAMLEDGRVEALGEGRVLYENMSYGFSVEYPETLSIDTFDEGGGAASIIFQNVMSEKEAETMPIEEKQGFQVFITPIEVETGEGAEINPVISRENILEDNPNAVVDEPIEVVIGDDIYALLFWGHSPEIGKTREVWIVYGDYLYEITTYGHLDAWLAEIMSTWKFQSQSD